MQLLIKVKPNSRRSSPPRKVNLPQGEAVEIALNAPPVDGKANAALIEVLSEHTGIKRSEIKIITGQTSRFKRIEVMEKPENRMKLTSWLDQLSS